MAETGTEAEAQRAQLRHTRVQKPPQSGTTTAVPIWKKEVLRSVQGNVEKEGKHPTLLKGDWNLISSTGNLYFSTLGTGGGGGCSFFLLRRPFVPARKQFVVKLYGRVDSTAIVWGKPSWEVRVSSVWKARPTSLLLKCKEQKKKQKTTPTN